MTVPSGIIVMWPGTAASIPAGWTRVTDLDSRHVKGTGAGINPNITGGAAIHTHTVSAHTHEAAATHSHITPQTGVNSFAGGGGADSNATDQADHHHPANNTGSIGGTLFASTSGSWDSVAADPSFFEVIWIESDGTPSGFSDGCLTYWSTSTVPGGWTQHAASKSKFLKGAAAAGNGGGTGGGSHTHTNPHLHAIAQHTHTGPTVGAHVGLESSTLGSGLFRADNNHGHNTPNFTSGAAGNSGSTDADSGSITYEPEFHTLPVIENTSGVNSQKLGHIVAWLGTLASIPVGWLLCDGTDGTPDLRGKFIKAANLMADIGTIGGAAGHAHASPPAHTHTGINHSHTAVSADNAGDTTEYSSVAGTLMVANHTHTVSADAASTGSSGDASPAGDNTADTQPPFRTVAYLYSPAAATFRAKRIAITLGL